MPNNQKAEAGASAFWQHGDLELPVPIFTENQPKSSDQLYKDLRR